jgi:hypothetical protein
MCYFFYLSTNKRVDPALKKELEVEEIFIDEVTATIGEPRGNDYYSIHRQCACDFMDPLGHRSNTDELKLLFRSLHPFQFIIMDGVQLHHLPHEAQQDYLQANPNEHLMELEEFLDRFPLELFPDDLYKVN